MQIIPSLTRREWEIIGIGIGIGMLWLLLLQMVTGTNEIDPSALIKTSELPGVISLSGTNDASMKAINGLNAELRGTQTKWAMPDLGYYSSSMRSAEQEDNAGIPTSLINFTGNIPAIPMDIGNATNVTEINETSEGLLYL